MLLRYDADAGLRLAGELDLWRTQLDYRGPLPRAWAGRLRRDLEAEAVAASTSMEGIPVTVEEVHRILAGDLPSQTREEDAALVRGYRDAMSFVLRRADDHAFRWDRELLIGLKRHPSLLSAARRRECCHRDDRSRRRGRRGSASPGRPRKVPQLSVRYDSLREDRGWSRRAGERVWGAGATHHHRRAHEARRFRETTVETRATRARGLTSP
jgi:hypothetical protein